MGLPHPAPGLGAMIDRASAFGAGHSRALISPAPTWVAAKLLDGETIDEANLAEYLEFGWASLNADFHRVGIWTQLREEVAPERQAKLLVDLAKQIENALGWPRGQVFCLVNDEIQGRPVFATRFCTAYRALAPRRQSILVPLGLGFLGGDGVWYPAECSLRVYRTFGFRDLAETFDGAMDQQRVDGVLRAHSSVFDAPKPLLPGTRGYQPEWLSAMNLTKATGVTVRGAAVFPGERFSPADWRTLGSALWREGLL